MMENNLVTLFYSILCQPVAVTQGRYSIVLKKKKQPNLQYIAWLYTNALQ